MGDLAPIFIIGKKKLVSLPSGALGALVGFRFRAALFLVVGAVGDLAPIFVGKKLVSFLSSEALGALVAFRAALFLVGAVRELAPIIIAKASGSLM